MFAKMTAVSLLLAALAGAPCLAAAAPNEGGGDLYTSDAIVTGTGEKNRQIGFRECLTEVLVKVSGAEPRAPPRPRRRLRSHFLLSRPAGRHPDPRRTGDA
ncbi:DUF2066 domain-containing protein [Sinorhizobium saheli]|nr:DUF2066 domain-containing protein [Sinorhizobium saheli]